MVKISVHLSSPLMLNGVIFAWLVRRLLWALVWMNRIHMRYGSPLPRIYDSGVVYARDRQGMISIVDAPTAFRRGWGHCAHLACWRVAELQEQGEQATVSLTGVVFPIPGRTFHVQVRREDGSIEDPSRMLGMV